MMNDGDNNRLMSDINVTPFVDVMLVLLIIFMVTAPMMIQGVDISLPETTSEPLASEEEPLLISIDRDGKIYMNKVPVAIDFLQNKLETLLEGRSEQQVFLRADRRIPYGTVVHVMSQIKGAGVVKLGIVTVPESQERTDLSKKDQKEE
jgi:biopolymer transport protein TolR